jgi:hypothetical protein
MRYESRFFIKIEAAGFEKYRNFLESVKPRLFLIDNMYALYGDMERSHFIGRRMEMACGLDTLFQRCYFGGGNINSLLSRNVNF